MLSRLVTGKFAGICLYRYISTGHTTMKKRTRFIAANSYDVFFFMIILFLLLLYLLR